MVNIIESLALLAQQLVSSIQIKDFFGHPQANKLSDINTRDDIVDAIKSFSENYSEVQMISSIAS